MHIVSIYFDKLSTRLNNELMGESNKRTVSVSLLGQTYQLRSDQSPEHLVEVAGYLDQKLKHISKGFPQMANEKIAILTALNIASELFAERIMVKELHKDFDAEIKQIDQTVDLLLSY